jgi:hypothetical protein
MATPKTTAEATRQAAAAAKLAETEGAISDMLEKQADNRKILNDRMKEGKDLARAMLEIEQEQALQKEKSIQASLQLARYEDLLQKKIAEGEKTTRKKEKRRKKELAQLQKKIDKEKEILALGRENSLSLRKQQIAASDLNKAQKKFGADFIKALNDAEEAQTRVADALADFADGLPVIGGSLHKIFKMQSKAIKLGGALEKMGGATGELGTRIVKFAKNLSFAAIGVFAIVAAAAAMALQFDKLSKEIGRATGLGDKFNQTLNNGYRQTMLSGVSMREYAGAVTSLANNFSGFNPTAEKTNIHLANTTSRLEKLGVSADSSSKLMDHFHRAMGLSQEMAADMTAQLVMLGRQVGITASKMAADFQASAGVLARYGKDQIKVFKQLAAQAKATGLEMGTLLGMAEKFDTFEGAADSAAKLNAVLGTQLSTIEMMNMNEADRVKMIKEQVQASVGNFDSLDKFTKMYVAQAMGVKDVAEAQRLLNMSQAETAANAAKMQEQADIQAELAKATAELVPMMTKLKIIGMKLFMVFSPLISAFEFLFAGFDMAYEKVASLFQGMGDLTWMATALKAVFIAVGVAALAFGTFITWPVAGVIALAAGLGALWDIFHKPGSPSMASGLFDSIGASIANFGMLLLGPIGAVAALAGGMSSLWDSMHKEESPGGFDIQAMAEIDTSKVAAGINEIKSAVMDLAGIKMDGFLAMHTDGSSSSFVMGSDGLIKSISEGKLIVDVKMPEMKLPEVLVKVFIGDRELKGIIRTEVQAQVGAMG